MPLVLGFAVIVGAVLLVTKGILPDASFADILQGKAGDIYSQDSPTFTSTPAATGGTSNAAGAAAVNSATGASPTISSSGYTDPLQSVTNWERTDQGVDATLPVGAAIAAPGKIKIMGVIKNWYSGQPYVWWQLLDGPDAGKYQYVAEQITDVAPVGSVLNAGDTVARYASSGTGIEFGWATKSGETLAQATTGYTEGYATQAGRTMRQWLDSLGAGAGTGKGLSIGAGPDPDDATAAMEHEIAVTKQAITQIGYRLTD